MKGFSDKVCQKDENKVTSPWAMTWVAAPSRCSNHNSNSTKNTTNTIDADGVLVIVIVIAIVIAIVVAIVIVKVLPGITIRIIGREAASSAPSSDAAIPCLHQMPRPLAPQCVTTSGDWGEVGIQRCNRRIELLALFRFTDFERVLRSSRGPLPHVRWPCSRSNFCPDVT